MSQRGMSQLNLYLTTVVLQDCSQWFHRSLYICLYNTFSQMLNTTRVNYFWGVVYIIVEAKLWVLWALYWLLEDYTQMRTYSPQLLADNNCDVSPYRTTDTMVHCSHQLLQPITADLQRCWLRRACHWRAEMICATALGRLIRSTWSIDWSIEASQPAISVDCHRIRRSTFLLHSAHFSVVAGLWHRGEAPSVTGVSDWHSAKWHSPRSCISKGRHTPPSV